MENKDRLVSIVEQSGLEKTKADYVRRVRSNRSHSKAILHLSEMRTQIFTGEIG